MWNGKKVRSGRAANENSHRHHKAPPFSTTSVQGEKAIAGVVDSFAGVVKELRGRIKTLDWKNLCISRVKFSKLFVFYWTKTKAKKIKFCCFGKLLQWNNNGRDGIG